MKLLLKELETHPPNRFYVGGIALLLGRVQALEALPAILGVLQDKSRHEIERFSAGTALGLMGKPALPALAEALKSSDVFGRRKAADALTIMGDFGGSKQVPEVISLLLEAMKDEDEEVRSAAIDCFGFEVAFTPGICRPLSAQGFATQKPLRMRWGGRGINLLEGKRSGSGKDNT